MKVPPDTQSPAQLLAGRIHAAWTAYSAKHQGPPHAIVIRKDAMKALREDARTAYEIDFADHGLTRERFMGMDVTEVDALPEEFTIRETPQDD